MWLWDADNYSACEVMRETSRKLPDFAEIFLLLVKMLYFYTNKI